MAERDKTGVDPQIRETASGRGRSRITHGEQIEDPALEAEIRRLQQGVRDQIVGLMEQQGVSKSDLARRLGKTKGWVAQLLTGQHNMTLRTIAEVSSQLGYGLSTQAEPLEGTSSRRLIPALTTYDEYISPEAKGMYEGWQASMILRYLRADASILPHRPTALVVFDKTREASYRSRNRVKPQGKFQLPRR